MWEREEGGWWEREEGNDIMYAECELSFSEWVERKFLPAVGTRLASCFLLVFLVMFVRVRSRLSECVCLGVHTI